MTRYVTLLALINVLIVGFLSMIPFVQMCAWEDDLRNVTNSTVVVQFEPIQWSIFGCMLGTEFMCILLLLCIIGFDVIIKILRQITWKTWMYSACFSIIITIIFHRGETFFKKAEEPLKNFCKSIVFNRNVNQTLIEDGYLPPEIYYSCLCTICAAIIINIQHIILIIMILKIKPKNFNGKSSTAETQEKSKIEFV